MDAIGSILNDDDDWRVLLSFLPESWQELAKETGALLRSRKFTPDNLLRSLLNILLMAAHCEKHRLAQSKVKLLKLVMLHC